MNEGGVFAPLAGVRVIDFSHILAGPFCTQMLADSGADVIKVEPLNGEFARIRGSKRFSPNGSQLSSYVAAVNRGKRSIGLNLKRPDAVALTKRLIASADVVVENFSSGVLNRLGINFARLREERPSLITVSITLMGSEGSSRRGLAIVAEAESGLTSRQRDSTGNPVGFGFPLGDMGTGLAAYGAILSALFHRERTNSGAHLNISMLGTLLALNSVPILRKEIAQDADFEERTAACGLFHAADGWVVIGVNSDLFWSRLAIAMHRHDLAENPVYTEYDSRNARVDEVNAIVDSWARNFRVYEIVQLLEGAGVPCGRVNTPDEALNNEEFWRLGLFETVGDGLGGTVAVPSSPVGSQRPGLSVPRLGEHTDQILSKELGIGPEEIRRLRKLGIVG
jgi:crotonobetainyl-CoA:carnitine CoA-transferase CaiB-like acyl-CoA transferase